jgi:N-acyl-phosphatidylethanolamine-hydrolysing phospholipase D
MMRFSFITSELMMLSILFVTQRWSNAPQHVDPDHAVQIHIDIGCRKSIGIHWATFPLGAEHYMESKLMLAEALNKIGLDKQLFITVDIGNIYEF